MVFSHGWPLSADDWDTQMMFFLGHGYRVVAHAAGPFYGFNRPGAEPDEALIEKWCGRA